MHPFTFLEKIIPPLSYDRWRSVLILFWLLGCAHAHPLHADASADIGETKQNIFFQIALTSKQCIRF